MNKRALEQITRACSLDGCPMFALAYMGRKRWAQPFNASAFCSEGKGCWCEQELSSMEGMHCKTWSVKVLLVNQAAIRLLS
jgi:hypothetical protein